MTHTGIRTIALLVALAGTALLAGCGGRPTLGDQMIAEGGTKVALGQRWNEVNAAIKAAENQIEDGEDLVEDGNDEIASGKQAVRDGERQIAEGEQKLEMARKQKVEIEEQYRLQGGVVPK